MDTPASRTVSGIDLMHPDAESAVLAAEVAVEAQKYLAWPLGHGSAPAATSCRASNTSRTAARTTTSARCW